MKSEQGILIGIDLGGTNVRVGSFSADGNFLQALDAPIEVGKGPQAGLAKIKTLIDQVRLAENADLLAIGIGSTGPLDRERGCIQNPYTLPGWEDVNIVGTFHAHYDVPVAFENDADAAALGEFWQGAGADVERLLMVTVGTGIGTGLILNGEIYRGMNGEHPEGGHVLVDPLGPKCYCGANGCWESLASGTAIGKLAREHADESAFLMEQGAGDKGKITGGMVFDGARAGDGYCLQLVDCSAARLALGLVSAMMMLLPDRVVMTGGVLKSYVLLEERFLTVLKQHEILIPQIIERIQFAALGQNAGLYGAARAAQLMLAQ